jgi:hypothetical protein
MVPNEFFQNKIVSEFEGTLKELAKEIFSKDIDIRYKIHFEEIKDDVVKPKSIKHNKDIPRTAKRSYNI